MRKIIAALCLGLAACAAPLPACGTLPAPERAPFTGGPEYVYLDAEAAYDLVSKVYAEVGPGLDKETRKTIGGYDNTAYVLLKQLRAQADTDDPGFAGTVRKFREALAAFETALEGL